MRHRVVIVGGGFAGLYAARSLKRENVNVTLIDRRNFHLFQPLLYQVATGALSPGEITAPLRHVLSKQKNTKVLLGEVVDIDKGGREVILQDHSRIDYDTLIVATGSTHHYFGHPEWCHSAPGLKTIEDATEIRTRVLLAFERAEQEPDPVKRRALLTFVVIGAGPTGVELAGALGEVSRDTLRDDFRSINPAEANIFLLEGSPRILQSYPEHLAEAAEKSLIELGVRTMANTRVTSIDDYGVTMGTSHILAGTVIWAAGVQASPLGHMLGVPLDEAGRVFVAPDLTVPGHPEIFVAGDLAHIEQDGAPVPGVAPAAIQQGQYVARALHNRLHNEPVAPFHYRNKGSLATIGRNRAVADFGKIEFAGYFAWLLWLFIHLLYIVIFENRVLIALKWAIGYFTFNRGARLITGDHR
jgi:NADH dehydrogenase